MRITFTWPTYPLFSGGVSVVFNFANVLARRGHEVHVVHGPYVPGRISHIDEIDWFTFDPAVIHHVIDDLGDPAMPNADVVFAPHPLEPRCGLPASIAQGYGLLPPRIDREMFRRSSPKICVASWLCRIGSLWGVPEEQLVHIPIGIDHDVFRMPESAADRPIDVAMLYSTHPAKGGDDGFAALAEVQRRVPDLRVTFFGYFRPETPIPDWAKYREAVSHEDLASEVYGRAKVVLQPSRIEGFGLTAVEGMACGAALVTTDNGGSSDYAFHDETAVVVPRRDVAAMADAVEALLVDDPRRQTLAGAGERFVRRFDWEESGRRMERFLEVYVEEPERFLTHPPKAPVHLDLEAVAACLR